MAWWVAFRKPGAAIGTEYGRFKIVMVAVGTDHEMLPRKLADGVMGLVYLGIRGISSQHLETFKKDNPEGIIANVGATGLSPLHWL